MLFVNERVESPELAELTDACSQRAKDGKRLTAACAAR
jgi:hypothetical protein